MMAPTRWADSADKHGVDRPDALHAMRYARVIVRRFDSSRVEGMSHAGLFIGPNRDGSEMLEVFAHLNVRAHDVLIFHVMPVRHSTIERAHTIIEKRKGQS